jgi:hypothetical protein
MALGIPQALIYLLLTSHVDSGRLSIYAPNDGFNSGNLACGGTFTSEQVHIAYRRWRTVGCKTPVMVCSGASGRCVLAKVMDAGPFGIYKPPLRHAVSQGRWRVWLSHRAPPQPWRYRAAADLSIGLWKKLGKPPFLSNVSLLFYQRKAVKFIYSDVEGLRVALQLETAALHHPELQGPSMRALEAGACGWPFCPPSLTAF